MITSGRLEVREMPIDQLFLMKLNAGRGIDTEDLRRLWPVSGFASPEAAVDAYYAAFPMEDVRDPHLADHIRNVCRLS